MEAATVTPGVGTCPGHYGMYMYGKCHGPNDLLDWLAHAHVITHTEFGAMIHNHTISTTILLPKD